MEESWAWLKRNRVWEAIRRVFLYAENWLQPERRDDPTPSKRSPDGKKSSQKKDA